MDFSNYVVTVCIFLTFLSMSYGQSSDRPVIVIDPGHGGTDAGAIGVNGVLEKDIVLSVAKKMDSLNTHLFDDRFNMYLTRYKDTLISLGGRTQLAKMLHADVFISLHCNQVTNKRVTGSEVYIDKKQKLHSGASNVLAFAIQKQLSDKLGFKSRGVKDANFQVLQETTDSCPAVLIELGFLSSVDEAQHLMTEEKYNGIALAILESINKIR
ncbi:N-acetylmuramoyl-L-alanine amidase [Maribacter sp. ANRC-HE7]|uniref:N-acetylmuramoyl-L-alanine amidase n=1 Tax=Maribacter aquimaris TaxID=2737171 RepID=A0ABR7UZL8_9FLAO|nr:N-acetylmuramoyl-L-alanine amidase [Maribacter aquimaris]MBD0777746.1 N-acetylmuramoyl-L-alanine amidase [Maribacter aquimaris]